MSAANLVSDAALVIWCGQSLASTLAVAGYRRGLPQPEVPGVEPNVAVILPVRGAACLSRLLPLLRAQHYKNYRIIASVESADDPAFSLLRGAENESGAPLETIAAGFAENAGQKVWNLLAPLDRLTQNDDIVAFIDSDTLPSPFWLPRLVALIVNSGRPFATGYRWMTPADDRVSSICLAVANDSIAALPRGALKLALVWGGSVAMRRTTLEAIGLRDSWRGAISDDAQIVDALLRAGLIAHAPRQGLLLTPVSCSWAEFLRFGVRQYRIVFIHHPTAWVIAFLCLWTQPVCFVLDAPGLLGGLISTWAGFLLIIALGKSARGCAAAFKTRSGPRSLARSMRNAGASSASCAPYAG